jgi:hypothetical protein
VLPDLAIRDAEHVHSAYLHPLAGRGYALELGKGGVCISGEISLAFAAMLETLSRRLWTATGPRHCW